MKNKLNYFIKILKLLFWPVIFTLTQFTLITIFTLLFNNNYTNDLKLKYPNLTENEINIKFEEITNTEEYIYELSEYLNNNSVLIIIITSLILLPFLIKKYKKIRDSNIKKIEKKDYLKIIITSILLSLSLNIIIYLINKVIPITNRYDDIRILLYNIIPIGIISPIIEEYIFRGVIFNKLKTFNSKKTSIIITTLIFSIMHFELSQIIYTLIVGYYLTYLYSKTNNLKTSIISHMAINTSTLLIVPLIVNTNIYIQSGILILIILSLYQIFSIKIK